MPVEIDPGTPVHVREFVDLPGLDHGQEHDALWGVSGTYVTATGEPVTISMGTTRKALSEFSNGVKRSLVPQLGDVLQSAVIYGHKDNYDYGVAHIRIDGRDYAVRLVIRRGEDGAGRLYQLEGFDLAPEKPRPEKEAPPIAKGPEAASRVPEGEHPSKVAQQDGGGKRQTISATEGVIPPHDPRARPASATPRKVSEMVATFKDLPSHTYSVFQPGEGAPRGAITLESNRTLVELFKGRDQSTFMHESSHLWLTEMARDAEVSPALR